MSDQTQNAAALRALTLLDLTDLSDRCTAPDIDKLCARAQTPHGHAAAICIWPQFVSQARGNLRKSPVRIATVINFPNGGDDTERAVEDTREALKDGAHEIDLVMPYHAFLRGDPGAARDMITAVRDEIDARGLLKVILETGALADSARIAQASDLAISAGADFIKTSTGKIAVSATPEAADTMLRRIKARRRPVGFKAAGGIRSLGDAQLYLGLADDIMGADWASPKTFRFGASGLLDVLLAVLGGTAAPKPGSY